MSQEATHSQFRHTRSALSNSYSRNCQNKNRLSAVFVLRKLLFLRSHYDNDCNKKQCYDNIGELPDICTKIKWLDRIKYHRNKNKYPHQECSDMMICLLRSNKCSPRDDPVKHLV